MAWPLVLAALVSLPALALGAGMWLVRGTVERHLFQDE
jgi:hypothetical protein